jgi:hypothetical protein
MSNDVRIHGYLSKPKGVHKQNSLENTVLKDKVILQTELIWFRERTTDRLLLT